MTDREFEFVLADALSRARQLNAKFAPGAGMPLTEREEILHDVDENYRCRRCGETGRSIVMKKLRCHAPPQGGDLLLRVQLVRPGQKIPIYSVDIDPDGADEISLGYPGLPVGNRTLYGLRVLLNLSAAVQDDSETTSAPDTQTGEPDAPDPVCVEGSGQREHQEGDGSGKTQEASNSDRTQCGQKEQPRRPPRYWLGEE